MQKNDIYETEITAYTSEGLGICRIEGMVVFVPETAVGDKLLVRILKITKNAAYGKKEKLLVPAHCRIANDCSAFPKCGGCDFRHISYEEELQFKYNRVTEALKRIGGLSLIPEAIIPSNSIVGYRNKAQFPVQLQNGKIAIGFYRQHSHDVVSFNQCHIQNELCNKVIPVIQQWMEENRIAPYDEATGRGIVRHIYIRTSTAFGDALVCLITAVKKLPASERLCSLLTAQFPQIKGILQCYHPARTNKILGNDFQTLYGNNQIQDKIGGLIYQISPQSFFQVNTAQAEKLYQKAKDYANLTGEETVIDLFCGTGTIGLFMADSAKKVLGIEIVPEAIENAVQNAHMNHISNAEFRVGNAANITVSDLPQNEKTVVVVDPPRKGLSSSLIQTIHALSPLRIVYISCDPATMARDIKEFSELGWNAERCCVIDMFPRTRHVETVVLLGRKKSTDDIVYAYVDYETTII